MVPPCYVIPRHLQAFLLKHPCIKTLTNHHYPGGALDTSFDYNTLLNDDMLGAAFITVRRVMLSYVVLCCYGLCNSQQYSMCWGQHPHTNTSHTAIAAAIAHTVPLTDMFPAVAAADTAYTSLTLHIPPPSHTYTSRIIRCAPPVIRSLQAMAAPV